MPRGGLEPGDTDESERRERRGPLPSSQVNGPESWHFIRYRGCSPIAFLSGCFFFSYLPFPSSFLSSLLQQILLSACCSLGPVLDAGNLAMSKTAVVSHLHISKQAITTHRDEWQGRGGVKRPRENPDHTGMCPFSQMTDVYYTPEAHHHVLSIRITNAISQRLF